MTTHTQNDRDAWAWRQLAALALHYPTLDRAGRVGTLRAILGAIDKERVEAEQRVLDAADEFAKRAYRSDFDCEDIDQAVYEWRKTIPKVEAQNDG